MRKSKSRKRDRKGSRLHESSGRSRYRSPSCSTCSRGRSRSHSRSAFANEERFVCRSRSCSPIAIEDERFRSSHGQSPIAIDERFGGRSRSHSLVPIGEERFGSSRGRSLSEERYREVETRRVKSVLAVTKTLDEDRDRIIKACDDYPSSRSNESQGIGNEKRNLEVGTMNKGSYDKRIRDEVNLSKDGVNLSKDGERPIKDSGEMMMKKEINVVVEDGGNEADELELILRQKALENFRKFRGGRPANRESPDDKKDGKKDETTKLESYQGPQNFVKPSESKHRSSINGQRNAQEEPNPNQSKARSVGIVPRKEIDGNAVRSPSNAAGGLRPVASSINSQNAPNQLKYNPTQSNQTQSMARSVANVPMEENDRNAVRVLSNDTGDFKPVASSITSQKTQNPLNREQVSSKKLPAEETSLAKDNQNLQGVAKTGSGKVSMAEVGTADKPGPQTLITENQNSKSNEPVTESASGSQFEQKTFSRMRDGEVVQVSYKVYIPKKTPALARRQLQRG